jgi:lipopolysaccharide export system permease protein
MRLFFLTATRVGDAVLSSGLLGHLLDRHPGARVTLAVGRPAAPLFRHLPGLERLIVVQKRRRGGHWLRLWRDIAATRWDLAVDLRASALTRLVRARRRLIAGRADEGMHRVVELGRLAGVEPPPAPRLWLAGEDRQAADLLLGGRRDFLAVGPTANWPGKQWPAERFAAVAAALTAPGAPLAGRPVVVFGAANERAMAEPLLGAALPGGLVDLVGRTELPVAGAALERAALFLGNDSGLMHMAAAAGVPTLGLFGPTSDLRYAPWGRHARALRTPESLAEIRARPDYRIDTDRSYMTGLGVECVIQAAEALLAERGSGR